MKKKCTSVLTILTVLLVAASSSATPAMDGPNATTITLTQVRTVGQPSARTWSASGGFVDSGSWFFVSFQDSGSILHSPVVGAAQLTLVLVGQDGSTITLEQEELITLDRDGFLHEGGSWHIVDGSGVYSTLHGAGRYSVDVESGPNTRTVTWQLDGNCRLSEP